MKEYACIHDFIRHNELQSQVNVLAMSFFPIIVRIFNLESAQTPIHTPILDLNSRAGPRVTIYAIFLLHKLQRKQST